MKGIVVGSGKPKLRVEDYTAADVLTKIKTVDGAGSGLDSDKLDGQEGTYYRNADQVDGLHFRDTSGYLEYSTDGGAWITVGLITTKPRVADFTQASLVANTWYTLLSVTGKGILNELIMYSATTNTGQEIEITIDGVTQVISNATGANMYTHKTDVGNASASTQVSGFMGPVTFLSTITVRIRATSGNGMIQATAHYSLM